MDLIENMLLRATAGFILKFLPEDLERLKTFKDKKYISFIIVDYQDRKIATLRTKILKLKINP